MNKRALTILSILNGLLTVLILAGVAIYCLAPQWLAGLEAALESADFNYKLFGGIFVIVNIVCTIILFICNEVCYDQHCDLDDQPAEPAKESSGETVYRTRLHFGRVKTTDEGESMKTKEERKAEREANFKARQEKRAQKAAKKAKKVENAVEQHVEKKVEKHVDSAVDSFIKSLKK